MVLVADIEEAGPKRTIYYARYNYGQEIPCESAHEHRFVTSCLVKDVKKYILEDDKNLKGKLVNLSLDANMGTLLSSDTPLASIGDDAVIYYDLR